MPHAVATGNITVSPGRFWSKSGMSQRLEYSGCILGHFSSPMRSTHDLIYSHCALVFLVLLAFVFQCCAHLLGEPVA